LFFILDDMDALWEIAHLFGSSKQTIGDMDVTLEGKHVFSGMTLEQICK
jgi:hypothetical protein